MRILKGVYLTKEEFVLVNYYIDLGMNTKQALNRVRLSNLIEEGLMKMKKKDKKYFLEIDDEDIEEFNCNYCYYASNNIPNSIPSDNNQTLCPQYMIYSPNLE